MSAQLWVGLVGAAIAGGAVTAPVKSWLDGRAQVAEELREQRLAAYPEVWAATDLVSRWPRSQATTYGDVFRFHLDLRDWYYRRGGLFMSLNARRRYGHMQELAGRVAALGRPDAPLQDEDYALLRDACSAFRTALTEDLESRRQRSLLSAVPIWLDHLAERRRAAKRLAQANARTAAAAAAATAPL